MALVLVTSCGKSAKKSSTGTSSPKSYTAMEAYKVAKEKVVKEWQKDAYLFQIIGGGSKAPVTLNGRTDFWQFQFYSPGAKKGREVTVDLKEKRPVEFTTVPYTLGKKSSLEEWLDSPKVVTAAEALGGKEARVTYGNIGLWYLMEASGKQTVCTVGYFICGNKERTGLTHGSVLQLLMDGQSGKLIQMQVKDGKLVQ